MLHLMFGKNVQLNAKQKVLSYFFMQALFRVIKLLLENYIVPFRKQTLYNDDFFWLRKVVHHIVPHKLNVSSIANSTQSKKTQIQLMSGPKSTLTPRRFLCRSTNSTNTEVNAVLSDIFN